MQLSLTVIGPQAERLGRNATKSWVDGGGTIGRAENNDWMLPDPKQEISRCHARIRYNGNVFYLEDTSANGVFLNDRGNRLDSVSAHRLRDGEQIFIGDYQIRVTIRDQSAVAARTPVELGDDSDEAALDPLELLGGGVETNDDYDTECAEPRRTGDAFLQDHFAAPEVRQEDPRASDPPAEHKRPAEGESGGIIPPDWWKQLSGEDEGTGSPGSEHASAAEMPAAPSSPERPSEPLAVPTPGGAGHQEQREETAADAPDGWPHQRGSPSPMPQQRGAGKEDALKALLAGAGVDPSHITPELADTLGQLLRVTVEGLMDLLRARMEVKNEFRMSVTLIQAEENNPLKFSTSAEDALHNLLVKNNPDYLGPVEAFRASFDDLRHHQMALLAGMRQAFFAMLDRFDPDTLERLFAERQDSGGVIGKVKRRRNWELYRQLFEDVRQDTESYFNRLFGEAFVSAYEKQMEELSAGARRRRRR